MADIILTDGRAGLKAVRKSTASLFDDALKAIRKFDPDQPRDDLGRTLYVSRPLLNGDQIVAWAKRVGFKTTVPPDKMHVTLAYSLTPVDWSMLVPDDAPLTISGSPRKIERLGDGGAAVALRFESDVLEKAADFTKRWADIQAKGASWEWPGYKPHVTISWDAGDLDISTIPVYAGALLFGGERFAEVREDWKETITEKATMPNISADTLAKIAQDPAFAELIQKYQPSVGDVHVSGADDDEKKKPKPAKKADFETTIQVVKTDADQRLIFGWASVSMVDGQLVVDKQGDAIEVAELEKAAYDFTLFSRVQGDMHVRKGVGRLVESMMFTPEKAACGITAKNDSGAAVFGWWTGFKVDDDGLWEMHKRGERPEFSIGGKAQSVEV